MASEEQVGNIVYQVQMDVANLIEAQRKVNERLEKMNGGASKAAKSLDQLQTSISRVASAIATSIVVEWGRAFLVAADNMNQLNARIERLTGSSSAAAQTMQSLMQISSSTGGSLQDTQKLWETLSTALRDTGATNSQIIQLTDTLQKIGRIGGSSSEEMANALRQFGQSISSGVVRAEEFNSVLEQMPELARQMAAGMGVSMGELRQLMLDGKLTAEDALNAIQRRTSSVNSEFDRLPRTISQANTALTNSFLTMVDNVNKATGASNGMVLVIDSLAVAIGRLTGQAATASQQIADLRSEAEMYARRARTWSWLGFGDWQKENEEKSAKLTAEAWEKASRAGWDAAKKVAKDSKPIEIKAVASASTGKTKKTQAEKDAEAYAKAQESVNEKLDELKQKAELSADSVEDLSRAHAILSAEQSLGNSATKDQIKLAGEYAARIWDTTNALKMRQQAEQASRFVNQEVAAGKTSINPVTGKVSDPNAQVDQQEQQKLLALQTYQDLGVLSVQQFEDAKTAIQLQASNARLQIAQTEADQQRASVLSILGSTSQGFDSLASIIANSAGKSNAAYQVMFAASKAFAIAQSTLSLNTAIMQAMADPTALTPAQKLANYAAIASAGASLLSNVASISYGGGREHGGPVSASSMYRVGEGGKPEIFKASNGSQYMIPGDNGRVISNRDMGGGGGGAFHYSPIINVNGDPTEQQVAMLEAAIKRGAQQGYTMAVSDVASGKGKLSNALSSNFNTSQRLT